MNAHTPLARVVGLWGAVFMGLGSILGTGVFVSLGIAAGIVGPGVVVAVALAALVASANGLSSAQLAAAHPVSGGTYEYGHRFLDPRAGFAAGFLFLAAKSASAATAALGCASYLLRLFGQADASSSRLPMALLLVLVLTALVAGGVQRSNRANIAIVSSTLLSLGVFIACGWASTGARSSREPLFSGALLAVRDDPGALLHATALMFVAYTGYGRIATLGEEVRDPSRTIPRAIVVTLLLSMLLYVAVAATAVTKVGAAGFASATGAVGAPLERIARSFRPAQVSQLISAGAVTAMAGVLLNLLLGLSRVLLAMARRAEMPTALARVDAATGSPTRAVWAIGALIASLVLVGDVRTTWSFSAFSVLGYYGLTNLCALHLPPELRRYPRWIALAGLGACFGLAFLVEPRIWLTGLGLLLGGFIWRAIALRRGA